MPFSRSQKTSKKQKNSDFGDFYFFRFFQPPMSNLQKNHVKIDVFNEPKYRFDPNQVHSSSFHPHKTPKKQKNIIFGTSLFWSKCLRLLYLRRFKPKEPIRDGKGLESFLWWQNFCKTAFRNTIIGYVWDITLKKNIFEKFLENSDSDLTFI